MTAQMHGVAAATTRGNLQRDGFVVHALKVSQNLDINWVHAS